MFAKIVMDQEVSRAVLMQRLNQTRAAIQITLNEIGTQSYHNPFYDHEEQRLRKAVDDECVRHAQTVGKLNNDYHHLFACRKSTIRSTLQKLQLLREKEEVLKREIIQLDIRQNPMYRYTTARMEQQPMAANNPDQIAVGTATTSKNAQIAAAAPVASTSRATPNPDSSTQLPLNEPKSAEPLLNAQASIKGKRPTDASGPAPKRIATPSSSNSAGSTLFNILNTPPNNQQSGQVSTTIENANQQHLVAYRMHSRVNEGSNIDKADEESVQKNPDE